MAVKVDKLERDMTKIVGKDHVFADKATMTVYAQDALFFDIEQHNLPYVVVRPSGAEEVSRILKYANERLVPVHIHGAASSIVGQARPKTNCILLDLKRMKRVQVFPERGYFEAEAGARVWEVRKVLAQYSAMLPIFVGSEPIATIGGVVSVNTSAHAIDAAFGKPADFVLGLKVVLPTGEVLDTGTQSTRRPAGVELTKLFTGAEGLLGVVTDIRMRLIPLPDVEHIVAYYKTEDDILDTVKEMYRQRIPAPLFFEFLDRKSAKVGFEAVGLKDPHASVAMMSIHCWSKVGVREKANSFIEFLEGGNPVNVKIVGNEEEWNKIWSSRSEAGNFLNRLGTSWVCEVTPRVDKLKDAYHEAEALISNMESYKSPENYTFGHIGAPTIHAHCFIPTKEISNEVRKAITIEFMEKMEGLNVKYGGCGGEWGLTALRIPFLKKKYGEIYYRLLVNLKKTLDPNNILDRGNLEGWI